MSYTGKHLLEPVGNNEQNKVFEEETVVKMQDAEEASEVESTTTSETESSQEAEVEAKEEKEAYVFTIKPPIDNVRIGGDALDQARRYCVTGFK